MIGSSNHTEKARHDKLVTWGG